MSGLEVLTWPDPALATACTEVGEITDEIRFLAADMMVAMYQAEGRGLAAPQVGRIIRLFVMDAAWKDGPKQPVVMVNPEIVDFSLIRVEGEEACLSLPGISATISRPEAITVSWTDLAGNRQSADLAGPEARVVQHEIDHLDGKVILDHLPPALRAEKLAQYAP